MNKSLFRPEVIENKRERLWGEIVLTQPKPFTFIAVVLIVTIVIMALLLAWGSYARKETVAGYLVPTEGLTKIYARSHGVISEKLVEEGDHVVAGTKILTVSTNRATAQMQDLDVSIINELKANQKSMEQTMETEILLGQLAKKKVSARIEGLTLEIDQLTHQLSTLDKKVKLVNRRVNDLKQLKKLEHISDSQFQREYESLIDNQLQYNEINRQITSKLNEKTAVEFELNQLPFNLDIRLTELRNAISKIKQRILEIEGQRSHSLYAPVDGRVTAIQVHLGQTISPNNPALAILPQGVQFNAHLFVPTRAIGFIKVGQSVKIRYAAFPYQRFGLHEGQVVEVAEVILSPNEIPVPVSLHEPVYQVTVKLKSQYVEAFGQSLPLQAGMMLDADIVLEKLSLKDWMLEPVRSLKRSI